MYAFQRFVEMLPDCIKGKTEGETYIEIMIT